MLLRFVCVDVQRLLGACCGLLTSVLRPYHLFWSVSKVRPSLFVVVVLISIAAAAACMPSAARTSNPPQQQQQQQQRCSATAV